MVFWQRAVQWGFVGLFTLVPLIWLPKTSELFEFPKILATYGFTVLIVGAWAARCISEKKIIFKRTLLDIPLLVFLGFSVLSLVFSIDRHVSFYGYYSRFNGGLLSLISYALLYWAFVSNMSRKGAVLSAKCSVLSAVVVAIYGALEHFGVSPSCILTRGQWGVGCWVQDVQTRVFATLGQPNWLAAYIAALIWIPTSLALSKKDYPFSHERIILIGSSLLLFATLLFTKSRSGLLAFGISAAAYWGVLFINHKSKIINRFAVFALCILTFIFLIPNPVRDLVLRTTSSELRANQGTSLETGGTESGTIRKIVWTGAIRIWRSSVKTFFLGTGPETFAMAYYQYRPVEHNQTSEWELLYNKAHNEFLNYLATTGILGLTSYLVVLGTMFKILISKSEIRNNDQNPKSKIQNSLEIRDSNFVLPALLAGWVSIIVTNFWGFSTVTVQLFLFLFPAFAIALNDN